jgi:hypothetical protein
VTLRMQAVTRTCPRCGKPLVSTGKNEYEAWGCYCDTPSFEIIVPPPITTPVTAQQVVDALRAELPRYISAGTCRFCDVDMYEDGVTPDTHAPGCVWVMAWNVEEPRG